MKIKSIKKIICDTPTSMMDILDTPNHNFLVATNNGYIVTHNTKGANIEIEKSKIMETYTSVLARIKSRFIVGGKVRGRLFLVSSKKSEYDFIEAYVRKVKGNPGVFIADARLYELKAVAFSGEKFRVAVGGSNLPSKIIPDDEDNETYIAQGYEIEEVPVELKQDFQLDMTRALRDHCGIAVSGVTRFIAYPSLEKCFIPQKNPFKSNVISVGMLDQLRYQDFFEPELVPEEIYTKPLFVHFDCSLTGDKTGIGCVAVLGYTNREGFDYITGEHKEIKELAYREVFDIGIQCPSGSEISFRKNREFVYYLKYELGWNIKGISLDGYQCLPKDTKVHTNDGLKLITELEEGKDKVLSYDIDKDEFVYTDFNSLRKTGETAELYKVCTVDGRSFECTPNHLVLTHRGYVMAKDLKSTDRIRSVST